jgi:hypothetical protein
LEGSPLVRVASGFVFGGFTRRFLYAVLIELMRRERLLDLFISGFWAEALRLAITEFVHKHSALHARYSNSAETKKHRVA